VDDFSLAELLSVPADAELQKVLDVAAHVGEVGNDEVNISYTSLLIGLLWSDDATSRWLQNQQSQLGVDLEAIYGHRGISDKQRDRILTKVSSGVRALPRKEPLSISARTVLREAGSIAQETGRSPNEPLGTRHLATVYFFRNPPGHNTQLHQEWGFEQEKWRAAFAQFIASQYPSEVPAWSQVLAGYLTTEAVGAAISGEVLGGYVFEQETIGVLRTLEASLGTKSPSVFSSEGLIETLAAARSVPDCATFADLVASRLGIKDPVTVLANPSPFAKTGSPHIATHGFKNILDRSRTLTRAITGTDSIGVRHIIASLLVVADSTANRRLSQSGVSLPLLREKLLKEFRRRWLNDDGVQWHFHLVGPTPPTIAGFHPDAAERGDDRLDVSRYARAFAIVMAADRVNPPLSIGIFGDWGSGKSFFMRLMSEETDKISKLADTDAEGKRLFCQRVVPIRFNAWHYAEGHLWASLVQTILEGLQIAVAGNKEGESEVMDKILKKLSLAQVARKEAQQALEKANERQKNSVEELRQARVVAKEQDLEVTKVQTRDVMQIVRNEFFPKATVKDALKVAENYLGLEGAAELAQKQQQTGGELLDLIGDARVTAARTGSTLNWLVRAPVSWRAITVLGVVSIAVLGLGAFLATRYSHAWPAIYSVVAEIGAVIAIFTGWAKHHLATVTKGLNQLDNVHREIDAKLADERAKKHTELAVAEKQRNEATVKVEQAQIRLNAAEEGVAKAERELQDSRSVNRIARLLEQRLDSKSYEQYLGIVAAIRADFQALSDLMKRMRDEDRRGNEALRPIDRIVLYIDDLDRCPSEKVVSVLEAIHLLLAFELFVVVVGVDIRWAARSLAEKYPCHLSAGIFESHGNSLHGEAETDSGSALDYLEKIFQIPFWLPPMEEDASRNMIAEMVPRTTNGAETPDERQTAERQADQPTGATSTGSEQEHHGHGQFGSTNTTKPALLTIEPEERNFMLGLAGAVGKSPRRLKRFVNTYRILKASLDGLQRETFVVQGGNQGEYRAAMALLALVTGAPSSSLGVLEFLAKSKENDALETLDQHVSQLSGLSEVQYAQAALAIYRKSTATTQPTVQELQKWAPRVARFSFRSGRM
jgi:KAP family P-loop domain